MSLIKSLGHDRLFQASLLLALLLWLLLWLVYPPRETGWAWSQPVAFLLLAAVFPLLEELTFRGLLQGWLQQVFKKRGVDWRLHGVTLCNLLTSLTFVAFHLFMHSAFWALAVFVPSLVYGYFRDKYQSVIPAIILHVMYNGGYFYMYPPLNT